MNLLDRYIARTVLLYTLMVTAVLLALASLFTFIGQQDDIGTGSYDVGNAFVFTMLSLPQQLFESLPIAALIGAILGLGNLARDSELIASFVLLCGCPHNKYEVTLTPHDGAMERTIQFYRYDDESNKVRSIIAENYLSE